jgi:cobalt-zinc-cadmium efflux system protein
LGTAHDHDHDHAEHGHDHAEHGHGLEHEHGHEHGHEKSAGAHVHGPGCNHDHVPASVEAKEKPAFNAQEAKQARRLSWVLAITSCFVVVEYMGARWARSDVIKADALHLFMDIWALAMSLVAMRIALKRPTPRFTFGLRRAEPVAAVINGLLILGAVAHIVEEAVEHLRGAEAPRGTPMLVVASLALVVNGISAWLLHGAIDHGHGHHGHDHGHGHAHDHGGDQGVKAARARGHDLNLRSAWLHLMGDTLGSVAALVAAVVVRVGGPASVDPIASFLVVLILVVGALRLLRDAVAVLLEAAPKHLPVDTVTSFLRSLPEVEGVSHVHVWSLGAGHDALMAHVRTSSRDPELAQRLSEKVRHELEVEYVTLQVSVSP